MRTETFELIKYLEKRGAANQAASHFADFIKSSPDKDEAAEEVRRLMVDTATQAVSLVQDMGLVAHDAFYPEESKRVIAVARRICLDIESNGDRLSYKMHGDSTTLFELKIAVMEYEENVLGD